MTKDVSSPFSPGVPVPKEFFVGRMPEIKKLREKVRSSLRGRVEVCFVAGERGIGKSSLLRFARVLAEHEHEVLGIHALMGGVRTVEEAVGRILDALLNPEVPDVSVIRSLRSLFSKYVKEVGLFGLTLSFEADAAEFKSLTASFALVLKKVFGEVSGSRKGLFVILDDINGLAASEFFGDWLKSLVDQISLMDAPIPLCIVLVGLDERRRELIARQPSLSRVFDVIEIATWDDAETKEFFDKAFYRAGMGKLEAEASRLLVEFAGGLPVLAHEIGDAIFNYDADGVVSETDAVEGIFRAADIVGRKYVDPMVFDSMRSKKYRTILGKLAKSPAVERFSRSQAKSKLGEDELRVFDNFLRKMKKLGVVVDDASEGRGAYRFVNRLHYLYICMEAQRQMMVGQGSKA